MQGARDMAEITHAHPLGIEGAVLIATATARALSSPEPLDILDGAARCCEQPPFVQRLGLAHDWIAREQRPDPWEVGARLGHGVAAAESCVTALYLGLRFLCAPFAALQDFVAQCGGDVDTLGAMSGALWGAANGAAALPGRLLDRLEDRARIEKTAEDLYRASFR
jgi:poly(ADP-ribose) glycohydrolase ARH3